MCGLTFEVDGQRILSVGAGRSRTFSPRATSAPRAPRSPTIHDDPDRLRTPLRRTPSGDFEPIAWDEAFELVARRLREIRARHGADAVALYMGNPIAHNHAVLALRNGLLRRLGTRNCTSAGSQDTSPRFAASYYLYGSSLAMPVPDIERTDYFLCLGANPRVSQRQLPDGAEHSRASASHSSARRPRGGGRSAPHRDRPRSRRARGDPARRRRGISAVDGAGDRRRRPRRRRESHRTGCGRFRVPSKPAWRPLRPNASRRAWASTPKRFAGWPANSPPLTTSVAYSRVGVVQQRARHRGFDGHRHL